jgi:hypothetical protein
MKGSKEKVKGFEFEKILRFYGNVFVFFFETDWKLRFDDLN